MSNQKTRPFSDLTEKEIQILCERLGNAAADIAEDMNLAGLSGAGRFSVYSAIDEAVRGEWIKSRSKTPGQELPQGLQGLPQLPQALQMLKTTGVNRQPLTELEIKAAQKNGWIYEKEFLQVARDRPTLEYPDEYETIFKNDEPDEDGNCYEFISYSPAGGIGHGGRYRTFHEALKAAEG